ncbi:MAG: deoxyribodipyrimidine photo-lyase [Armatimonadetes bacterium]|nr:deoxyribodipyrimidine photo-lyase [Armatimonadota bacterium]
MYDRALCWLRRDLRVTDNCALALATLEARNVFCVFVFDTVILDELTNRKDKRVQFIFDSVMELRRNLQEQGSDLIILHGDPLDLIPEISESLGAEKVFWSHDDDPYALDRDSKVRAILDSKGVFHQSVKDHVVFERQEVLNRSGEPFKVFTPYSKAWLAKLEPQHLAEQAPILRHLAPKSDFPEASNLSLGDLGFQETDLWLNPGESAAKDRLLAFLEHVDSYGEERDFPTLDSTSGLSVHLRHGTISNRECFREAMKLDSVGAKKWVSELIWREFYHMILANFPHVGHGRAFQPHYNDIEWPGSDEHFTKWCEGKTGYPLVDAAMRCLNETGWMHNRLRMVVAMFLTKDLLVDWRKGEAYFAENLLDFELASNNGGWQWSASTGVDAQPYFRIFNPILQSLKFDTEGKFIKEWVPELKELEGKFLHFPFNPDGTRTLETPADYPDPIVIHSEQKEKALSLFKRD